MSDLTAQAVREELVALANASRAKFSIRYFRTGEEDHFLGVTVPEQRKLARRFQDLPRSEVDSLLQSQVHEHRLTALLILVRQYERAKRDATARTEIYEFFLSRTVWVNNWDLVDTAARIVGWHLAGGRTDKLDELAGSPNIWERRIAMVACQPLIQAGDRETTLRIADRLWEDREDLIHKVVGWMLREWTSKQGQSSLVEWLAAENRLARMPRTALRYAIEHFPPEERRLILAGDLAAYSNGKKG